MKRWYLAWTACVLSGLLWSSHGLAGKPTSQPAGGKGQATKGTTLSAGTFKSLLLCSLMGRFDTYQSTQKTMKFGRRRLGMFTDDWDTMLFVYKVPKCVAKFTGQPKGTRPESISQLSGLPLYGPKQASQRASSWINYYNPALLGWLARHVPKPSYKLLGVPYQKLYRYTLQRLIRITAYTYLYLQEGKGKKLYQAYAKLHAKPAGATGTRASLEQRLRQRALRNKIKKSLKMLVRDSSIVGSYIEFHPGKAALFLMRRMMGGTDKALWALLKQILDQYDPAFLPRVTKKRPLGVVDLFVAKTKKYKPSVWEPSQAEQVGIFVNNAPPYTRIQLRPGVYRINSTWQMKGLKHVILEGIGKGKVEIVSSSLHDTVLDIVRSQDIQIRNLHMRHTKPSPNNICSGQVIKTYDSHRIWIDGNELNGSGTVGVEIIGGGDVVITRNHIHSNTQVGVSLFMTKDISILHNKIVNNAAGINCQKCSVVMGQNTIRNNKVGSLHRRAFARSILKKLKQRSQRKK